MPTVRRSVSLAVLGAALGAALVGCARHDDGDGLPEGIALEDLPDGESWDADLRVSEGGTPVLQISAPYLARFERPDSSFIRLGPAAGDSARVRLVLFDDAGERRAELTAAEMRYEEGSGRVQASGAVEAELAGRARVRAPRVDTSADGAFEASGGARVELLGATEGTVTAERVASSAAGGFVATGDARADLRGATPATLAAPRIESGGDGAFSASGGARVVLSDPAVTLTARRVSGTGRRTLAADRVSWDAASERFRAPGAFTFTSAGERIRGTGLVATADLSRYTFRNASGQIEVEE